MSTPATADLGSDEEDVDYVPTSPKRKTAKRRRSGLSSSSTSSGHDEVDEVEVKRSKLVAENERRLKAAEAFAAMREEGVERSSREADKLEKEEMEMVEVKRARRFAGETSYESVMLPSTDPEAVAYLAQQRVSTTNGPTSESTDPIRTPPTSTTSQIYSSMAAPQPFPPQTSIPSKPTPKPPVRRKPRQSLEQMSAALSSGKKMTTLEKSQLDWYSHMASDEKVKDELEANRRSGGFLQKREFLDRVGERRTGAPEGKGGRR